MASKLDLCPNKSVSECKPGVHRSLSSHGIFSRVTLNFGKGDNVRRAAASHRRGNRAANLFHTRAATGRYSNGHNDAVVAG